MKLIVTLIKEVETIEQGEQIFQAVKTRYADQPDIKVSGHITNHFVEPME